MKKPLISVVADDLRKRSVKKSKQYIVHVLGVAAGVTFDAAEETRVKAEAARRGVSVEDLIAQAVLDNAAASKSRREDIDGLIVRTVASLGAPRKRAPKTRSTR